MLRLVLDDADEEPPFLRYDLFEIPALSNGEPFEWESAQKASSFLLVNDGYDVDTNIPALELKAENYFFHDGTEELGSDLAASNRSSPSLLTEKDECEHEKEAEHRLLKDIRSRPESGSRPSKDISSTADQSLSAQPQSSQPQYLSEADLAYFDAFLRVNAARSERGCPKYTVQHQHFLQSVFEVGSGRESSLYRYDAELAEFVSCTEEFSVCGLSSETQRHFVKDAVQIGKVMRDLDTFTSESRTQSLSIAFSAAVSAVVSAVRASYEASRSEVTSLLQLHNLFERPAELLAALQNLLRIIGSYKDERDILVELVEQADILSARHIWQREILHQVLAQLFAPWIARIQIQSGLDARALPSHVNANNIGQSSGASQATCIGPIEQLAADCRCCLQYLEEERIEHQSLNLANSTYSLAWEGSWHMVVRMQAEAEKYEDDGKIALLGRSDSKQPLPPTTNDGATADRNHNFWHLETHSVDRLDQELGSDAPLAEPSRLFQLTTAALAPKTGELEGQMGHDLFPPLGQSLPLSLVPLLSAQSRLLSFSVLRLLFETRSILQHLSLLHRFSLMADGLFALRLSRALFDPATASAEGLRIAGGTTGLRLPARETWPPASSELRLALMGILEESIQSDGQIGMQDEEGLNGSLLDAVSFAIRDLTPEEIARCTEDVASIHALDFLQLQYKPPQPLLAAVISSSSLEKYDGIFQHMTRLLRVQSTVAQLFLKDVYECKSSRNSRSVQKGLARGDRLRFQLRLQMQHFVSSMLTYAHHSAINPEWSRMWKLFNVVDDSIRRHDYDATIARAGTLPQLQRLHADTVDRVYRNLFLDPRHSKVRRAIERMFDLILRFLPLCSSRSHLMITTTTTPSSGRDDDKDGDRNDAETMQKLVHDFQRQLDRITRHLQLAVHHQQQQEEEGEGKEGKVACAINNEAPAPAPAKTSSSVGDLPPFNHLLTALESFHP